MNAQESVEPTLHGHQARCVLPITEEGRISAQSRGAYVAQNLWEAGRILRVRFINGTFFQRERVERYAREWEQYANIRFDFNSTASDAEIRILFDPNGGNSSFIGTDAIRNLDEPSMSYDFGSTTSEERIKYLSLHEFGHALGLTHEHQHPGSRIDWNREAVIADIGESANINVFPVFNDTDTTAYDVKSVMHYDIPATWTNDGFSVPLNSELSDGDKEIIGQLYPFPATGNCAHAEEAFIVEDFESYTVGQLLGPQSDCWIPYSGVDGSIEDVPVSDGKLHIQGTNLNGGGPQDMVLELGDKNRGVYVLEFSVFMQPGDKAYYNLLHQFLPEGNSEHASEVYFYGNNTGYLRLQGQQYTFPYYTGKWTKVVQRIDFDKDETTLFIADKEVKTWQFSYKSYNTEIGTNQLSAINFYPVDNTFDFYVDNISLSKVMEDDCACTNQYEEDICEDFDAYSPTEFLGPQSPCWMPWNGENRSNQDVKVNTFSGSSNLRIAGTTVDNSTGGPVDMVLALGNKTTGVYDLEFSIYVPSGHKGYYNILHDFTPGGTPVFASEIYFYESGLGVLRVNSGIYPFRYQPDHWNKVSQSIDLNKDKSSLYVDDEKVLTWQFSLSATNNGRTEKKLSAIDFYPVDNTYEFYIDNIKLTKKSPIDGEDKEDNKVVNIAVPTSLRIDKEQKTLHVFPNPSSHLLNISLGNFKEEALVVRLVNMVGQEVYQQDIVDSDTLIQIDVSNFPKGTYLLSTIDSKGGTVSKKVLITK